MRPIWTLTALFAINTVVPARGAPAQISTLSHPLSWTTLGTQGGPILNAKRSQPANLLVVDGKPWLVDCGDGALERLAAAGYDPLQVNTAFISHLHMDHIGGLQGLIGLRWFGTGKHSLLTIYGPPGTDVVIAGIMQSLKPSVEIGMGLALAMPSPEELTKLVIVNGFAAWMGWDKTLPAGPETRGLLPAIPGIPGDVCGSVAEDPPEARRDEACGDAD